MQLFLVIFYDEGKKDDNDDHLIKNVKNHGIIISEKNLSFGEGGLHLHENRII